MELFSIRIRRTFQLVSTGQGLYGLRTASLDEGSPRGSESKNRAGNDEKEVERIKNVKHETGQLEY